MPATTRLAEAIFALSKRSWIETSRQTAELTEPEFLALDHLVEAGTATVGQIQRQIGVLPAQMSRHLRRLRSAGFVTCQINRDDRRKVNVAITQSGGAVHAKYRRAKLAPIIAALERLTEHERSQFMGLVQKMAATESYG